MHIMPICKYSNISFIIHIFEPKNAPPQKGRQPTENFITHCVIYIMHCVMYIMHCVIYKTHCIIEFSGGKKQVFCQA